MRRGWLSLPGLTVAAIDAHPIHSPATAAGHLKPTQQGRRSTKSYVSFESDQDLSPVPSPRTSLRGPVYTNYVDFHSITDTTLHADLC